MTKSLLYMAPIVLIGLVATEASAATAAWSGSIGRNITATAPEGTGVPLVLVCQRGGRGGGGARAGGGGARGWRRRFSRWRRRCCRGGGGGSWAGAGRGNFSGANANRGNVSGANVNRGNFSSANVNRGNFNSANVNRGNFNNANVNRGNTTSTSTATSTSAVVATEAVITGEVGAASPPASRRVPSSAVPLPVRPIRPRHTRTRTRLVHTQITRIADFERLQHDGTLSRRDSLSARESGWRVLASSRPGKDNLW